MNREAMGSEESPKLRTVAILVWHHQRMGGKEAWAATLETMAEQQHRVERFCAELRRIVGERDDVSIRINGGCIEADVEDLRFVALENPLADRSRPVTRVTLLGRCTSCGSETISSPLNSLAGLGKILERFEPSSHHICHERLR